MLADIKKNTQEKMQSSLDVLANNLAKVRTGRAHPSLLDHIQVEYYGSMVPVNQVGNVTVIDSRTLGVQAFERTMVSKIEKAIRDSDLGLNPAAAGEVVRVPMPMLTEERRKDLIKVVRAEAESGRVAIRNVRRDANNDIKNLEKNKDISEDDAHRAEDEVQKLTDQFITKVDAMLTAKEQDLMAI